ASCRRTNMPSLSDAINTDLTGYSPVEQASNPQVMLPSTDMQPGINTMIRCPLPPIFQAQPDSLRQFYQSSVPQTRLLSPITSGSSGGGSTGSAVTQTTVIAGGSVPAPATVVAKQAVVTTTTLAPGQKFIGALNSI